MMTIRRKILPLAICLAILIIVFALWQSMTFRMTNTWPSLSKVPSHIPYIDLRFNKNLAGASVSASPNVMKSYKLNGDYIRVNLRVMQPGESYKLFLSNIRSAGGKTIVSKNLSFVAQDIPFENLSADEQKAIVNSQDPNDASFVTNDPLLAHLPYGGIGWEMEGIISSSGGKSVLTVRITVTFSNADYKLSTAQKQTLIKQRENEALSYIKSLGLNPAKYKIKYIVPAV